MNQIERRNRWFGSALCRGVLALGCFGVVAMVLAGCRPDGPGGPTEPGFSVTLEWIAPTVDADGAPLEDLLGYTLHYRATTPANAAGSKSIDAGLATRFTATSIPAGVWFFGVTARDATGNESALSNEVRVEVGP